MNKKLLIKFFVNHFKKNRFYLILLILSSIFCAISEGIGVFLIFPLLMPDQAIQNFADIEILQPIIKNFTNYSSELKIYVVSLIIISLILIRFIFLLIVNYISVYLPLMIESNMISQYYEKSDNLRSNSDSGCHNNKSDGRWEISWQFLLPQKSSRAQRPGDRCG